MADKILIVDDDRELRSELKDLLEGYNVVEAQNGEEAIEVLRRANEIGLVILDIMMPGLNGIDILGMMKKIDPDLHIIILTGHSSKEVAIEALKAHADDYIEKPVNISNLTNAVDRLLGARPGGDDMGSICLKDKVERVKGFIERNRYKKITLKEAADYVCLSSKYLSRVFRHYAKTGFGDYKLRMKMNAAKDLLKKSRYNIDQISYKLGYKNEESLVRQFKKITRQTPTEYRRGEVKKQIRRKVKR